MALPNAVSLAVGSLLVVLLSYRAIFVLMAVVTGLAALYTTVLLRDQIRDDVRRPPREVADQETAELVLPVPPTEL
jgi:hypothetical protein